MQKQRGKEIEGERASDGKWHDEVNGICSGNEIQYRTDWHLLKRPINDFGSTCQFPF